VKVDFLISPELTTHQTPLELAWAGQIADENARRRVLADYQERKAQATLDQQKRSLKLFRAWLRETAADPGDLYGSVEPWAAITWGLVADFLRSQLGRGYAVTTVNIRLATLKRYAAMAMQAGALDPNQYAMIRAISGYARREARNLDQKRQDLGLAIRTGHKAAAPILLGPAQVKGLKADQPDPPQGRRDALLMCLLLDHGLRCGEVAALRVGNLNLERSELHFDRPKVGNKGLHELTADTRQAGLAYLKLAKTAAAGPLLLASHKAGGLVIRQGLSVRAINLRVRILGERLGIEGLSPHDCRHTCATELARQGYDVKQLMDIFGWASPAMAVRYVQSAQVSRLELGARPALKTGGLD
jgi:integrase